MWRKIGKNDNYSINEQGQVRNDNTNHIKEPYLNVRNGYLVVDLYENNKSKKLTVHRLLAEAFIPNPESKPTVDHIDGDRTNNSLENLRWATYGEQNSRFGTLGVRSEAVVVKHYEEKRKNRGGGHEAWLDVKETLEFKSITEAAQYFGFTTGNVSQMLKKGTIGRRGTARGYQFLYKHGERATHS